MARTAEQTKIYNKERYIGRKAAKMAESYLLSRIDQKLNIHGEGGENFKPILEATKIRAKMGNYRLLGLNLTSTKAGFILHHGFSGVRYGGTVLLQAARYHKQATTREDHTVNLPAEKLFENIYEQSGAIEYMVNALSETRTDAIKASINGLIVQLNSQENGQ